MKQIKTFLTNSQKPDFCHKFIRFSVVFLHHETATELNQFKTCDHVIYQRILRDNGSV